MISTFHDRGPLHKERGRWDLSRMGYFCHTGYFLTKVGNNLL
jgi:hypothetical protein